MPEVGQSFDIVHFGTNSGEFRTIFGQDLGGGKFFDPIYDTDRLTLQVAQASPGDADFDHDVDLSDLGTLAMNYGLASGMQWTDGDFDGDGDVDLSDLGALATNYESGQAQAIADF